MVFIATAPIGMKLITASAIITTKLAKAGILYFILPYFSFIVLTIKFAVNAWPSPEGWIPSLGLT